MSAWRQYRAIVLGLAFASVLLAIGRLSLDDNAGKRSLATFTFPKVVPLPEWQLIESRSLSSSPSGNSNYYNAVSASQKYTYRQQQQQLEIEMRYAIGTLGEFPGGYLNNSHLTGLHSSAVAPQIQHRSGIGFYTLFVHQGRSYLSACINPRGNSTVTVSQFLNNRNTYDLQPLHVMSWLVGQASLIDRRCLWTHLSIPVDSVAATRTYPVLERAWLSWYSWWRDRFPQY